MASNYQNKNNNSKKITIILVAILIAVIGVNIYLFASNQSKRNDATSDNHSVERNTTIIESNDVNEATPSDIKEGYVIATKLDANFVLDIENSDISSGANLQLWERNINNAQTFELKKLDDGYYQIININSGKALAAENGGKYEHTNVCQEDVGASNSQYWSLISAGNDYYYIIEKTSGLYLDVDNAWTENGTNIKLFSQNEAYEAQKWKLIKQ